MTEDLRISMIQSHIIWEDREENLGYYGELLRRVSGRTDLAVLPETFTTGFSMDVEKQADTMEGQTVPTIKEWAKKYKLAVAGSLSQKITESSTTGLFSSLRKERSIITISVICSVWRKRTSISRRATNV